MRDKSERNCYYDKTNNKWKVQFGIDGRNVTIGSYYTKELAIAARDQWIRKNGEPKRGGPPGPRKKRRANSDFAE